MRRSQWMYRIDITTTTPPMQWQTDRSRPPHPAISTIDADVRHSCLYTCLLHFA
jgi:hypothetical protein